jgi:hypothetical protein
MAILATITSKTSGKTYTITRGNDGVTYCDCPSWKFQRVSPADRTCKHINSLSASNLKTGAVMESSEAGKLLGASKAKIEARKAAHTAHKTMTKGSLEAAVAAAKTVASIKGASKNLKALAEGVLATVQ